MEEKTIILSVVLAVALVSFVLMLSNVNTGMVYIENTPTQMENWRVSNAGRALWGAQKPYGEALGVLKPEGGEYLVDGKVPGNLGQTGTNVWDNKKGRESQYVTHLSCLVSGRGDLGLEYPKIEADRLKGTIKECYGNYRNAAGRSTIYIPLDLLPEGTPSWEGGMCCFDRQTSTY
ncbi:hypothetical protein KY346_01565 [Candidatus Woesearchaeota archaeon]|nr:hypothetical protein [Candidatus Woesearchaeota archaeon]